MKICFIPVEELDSQLYTKLKRLNLGDKGLMRYYLQSAYLKDEQRLRYRKNESVAVLQENGCVVCWALILEFRQSCSCKWRRYVHIYTRSSERGKGYAHYLMQKIIDFNSGTRLYCRGNTKFYRKYGIKYV